MELVPRIGISFHVYLFNNSITYSIVDFTERQPQCFDLQELNSKAEANTTKSIFIFFIY